MNNNEYAEIARILAKLMADAFDKKDQSDKTIKAKVITVKGNGKYEVLYSGKTHTVSSSIPCTTNDYVWVCAPCNNWNNLFVVCKTK